MNNKKLGNKIEKKLIDELSKMNYWCHLFSYNANGQPCDVIAIKKNKPWLIDVKHCDTKDFYFRRIEDNQRNCFNYALECGNSNCGFAIYYEEDGTFRWLSWTMVLRSPAGTIKIDIRYLPEIEVVFE